MAIDFKIRDFAYPVSILRLHRTLQRTQWLPPAELRQYQDARLQLTLRHAAQEVPYYRRLFERQGLRVADIRTAADLPKLPLLTRADVRRAGATLRARHAWRYRPRRYTTSGSTGEPLQLLLDRSANTLEFVYYWRHWSWAGYRLGDGFAEFATEPFLRRPEWISMAARHQPLLRRLLLNGAQLGPGRIAEMAVAIRRHQPRFIKGMASTLYHFARLLDLAGITDVHFDGAFSTGELLAEGQRRKIASVLSCPVLDSYGHMERTVAISQCLAGGYHVNADYGVLELSGPGPDRAGGSGSRMGVGTSLHNLAMPFIRYELGDLFEPAVDASACRCGRTLPLVKAIAGRSEDVIVTPDGRCLTGVFLLSELVRGIEFAQFVQQTRGQLLIRVVPAVSFGAEQEAEVRHAARRLVGPSMQVELERVEPTDVAVEPSGKRRIVISEVEPPG